jgi:dihydrofolate reductase
MGLLTFGLNVTLDGCIDHTRGSWTMSCTTIGRSSWISGAMLFGRNTYELMEGDLREAISALKAKTERGVLVGAPKLAAALEELGLIDEYRIVVHPIISGCGPTLFHGLSSARHLEHLSTQRFKSGVQALHFRRKAG